MNTCDAALATSDTLWDEVIRHISPTTGEDGPLVAIIDDSGKSRSNDPEKFGSLFDDAVTLETILARIADGAEPVVACVNDYGIAAGQLSSGWSHRGYVVIGLKGYSLESTVANLGIVETLLNQISTIASLIERPNHVPHGAGIYPAKAVWNGSVCVN